MPHWCGTPAPPPHHVTSPATSPSVTCRGLGDTRTPFVGTLLANVLNIGLEPLLIFKMGWGVAGAATAVGMSQVCVAALS